ncbi:MAG TPA: hypothetical protein VME69_14700 [Methylocella sp.]|nr:hypothetical protein [Methylocella sp.]
MNWRTDLCPSDSEPQTSIEVTCKRCGPARYEKIENLLKQPEFDPCYLDEVGASLTCNKRGCSGAVKIALPHGDKMEGFIGGMP